MSSSSTYPVDPTQWLHGGFIMQDFFAGGYVKYKEYEQGYVTKKA
jgi:hypothetical protein